MNTNLTLLKQLLLKKRIKLSDFDEAEFNNDLTYITNLYKAYEVRFENATLSETDSKSREVSEKKQMQYEELKPENVRTYC